MKDIWGYKTVKIIIGILIPATLGFYQAKLNNVEAVFKYTQVTSKNELIN